jgi:CpXC protein
VTAAALSHVEPVELICPCGAVQHVNAADNLHVTDAPAIREAIKLGGFHVFPCPSCGARVRLERLLAYTDFERWHWFAVFPDRARQRWTGAVAFAEQSFADTVAERSAPLVQSWAPRFRPGMRAIFGLESLREKLLAFDAGLDDRVLETLKLQLIRWYALPWREHSALLFDRIDNIDDKEQLVFAWSPTTGIAAPPPQGITVPLDVYRRLCLDAEVRQLAPALFTSIAVDARLVLPSPSC